MGGAHQVQRQFGFGRPLPVPPLLVTVVEVSFSVRFVDRLQRPGVGHRLIGDVELAAIRLQRAGIHQRHVRRGVDGQDAAGRLDQAAVGDGDIGERAAAGQNRAYR